MLFAKYFRLANQEFTGKKHINITTWQVKLPEYLINRRRNFRSFTCKLFAQINRAMVYAALCAIECARRSGEKVDLFSDAYVIKSSFGFGDVNGCLLFKKWNENGTEIIQRS